MNKTGNAFSKAVKIAQDKTGKTIMRVVKTANTTKVQFGKMIKKTVTDFQKKAKTTVIGAKDTLSKIAKGAGVTVKSLLKANNISSSKQLRIGDKLKIPGKALKAILAAKKFKTHVNDTLSSIAKKNNVSTSILQKLNGIKKAKDFKPGSTIKTPAFSSEADAEPLESPIYDEEDIPEGEEPAIDDSYSYTPIKETPIQPEQPYQDYSEPIQEEPIQEEPIQEEPIQEEPIQEEPIQEEPIEEEPIQEEPIEEEPIQEEPAQEDPSLPDEDQEIQMGNTTETKTIKYKVSNKETIFSIADKFYVDPQDLLELNKKPVGYIVLPGDVLTITYKGEYEQYIDIDTPSKMPDFDGKINSEIIYSMGWGYAYDSDLAKFQGFANFTINEGRIFMALATFYSQAGNQTYEYQEEEDKWASAGFLNLVGEDNYTDFANFVGDRKVMSKGQEYVGEKYPWLSAAFVWKMLVKPLIRDQEVTLEQVLELVQGDKFGFELLQTYYDLAAKIIH